MDVFYRCRRGPRGGPPAVAVTWNVVTRRVELVATSAAVAATSSRRGKIDALSELLGRWDPTEIEVAVALLTGAPRQGRIGVAWARASTLTGSATTPSVEIDELDVVLDRLEACTGPGSERLRAEIAAGRRGKAWRKVEPVHTLDLVVLAVEWGSGRRRGLLSNLHLGALDADGAQVSTRYPGGVALRFARVD